MGTYGAQRISQQACCCRRWWCLQDFSFTSFEGRIHLLHQNAIKFLSFELKNQIFCNVIDTDQRYWQIFFNWHNLCDIISNCRHPQSLQSFLLFISSFRESCFPFEILLWRLELSLSTTVRQKQDTCLDSFLIVSNHHRIYETWQTSKTNMRTEIRNIFNIYFDMRNSN